MARHGYVIIFFIEIKVVALETIEQVSASDITVNTAGKLLQTQRESVLPYLVPIPMHA